MPSSFSTSLPSGPTVRTATECGLAALWLLAAASPLQAQTVFACEPEWAALTRVLLPQATVHVATHAHQDPHHIEARPALIAQLRSADAAICTGASLEAGWLPMLRQRAGNAAVQDGAPGMFYAASTVTLIDARPGAGGSPFAGDVHAEGNPHLHTDPHRLLQVASAWSQRLQQLFPAQATAVAQRQMRFESDWRKNMARWEQQAAPLRGSSVVAQHASFAYLWNWLGLRQVADLEPRPGLAPTPGHLQSLLDRLKSRPPRAVVVTGFQNPRAGRWLTEHLGMQVPLLQLPASPQDPAAPEALERWMDGLVGTLSQLP